MSHAMVLASNLSFDRATCYGVDACQAVADPSAFLRGVFCGIVLLYGIHRLRLYFGGRK